MTVLSTKNLSFKYKQSSEYIFKDVNLNFKNNSFNLLIGPSGSGKSTLLKTLAGLYPEFGGQISGNVYFNDTNLNELTVVKRSKKIAILFQNANDQFAMKTPFDELVFTLENLKTPVEEIKQKALAALEFINIIDLKDHQLNTLSGGEAQKVALAICLVMDSDIILLDEPFASVDPSSRLQLIDKLIKLNDKGKTIIISDHDLSGYENLNLNMYGFQSNTIKLISNKFDLFKKFIPKSTNYDIPSSDYIFNFKNLSLKIDNKTLLNPTTLGISKNKFVLITGPNGVGKSTLFSALTRLKKYDGLISYQDKNIQKFSIPKYAKEVALVFQIPTRQYLKMTVLEEINLSLKHAKYPNLWQENIIQETLSILNLENLTNQVVYKLSGGQQKKLQILIMLILGTSVLLFDEPLAGLDIKSVIIVMDLIKQIAKKQNQTILMITHQLSGVSDYFDNHLIFDKQTLTYEAK